MRRCSKAAVLGEGPKPAALLPAAVEDGDAGGGDDVTAWLGDESDIALEPFTVLSASGPRALSMH